MKIIKLSEEQILFKDLVTSQLNEEWGATCGFSNGGAFINPGFSYEVKPLSYNLSLNGNDIAMVNKNKSFQFFPGEMVKGYCPYDKKKHRGMIKYLYYKPGSNEEIPDLVYILDFSDESTIALEGKSIKKAEKMTINDLTRDDYFRAREQEIAHDYALNPVIENLKFDFNKK